MFLNQRPIDVPRLSRAINEVYRSLNAGLIKSNQYPSFILNLSVPSGEFDVNVTPDKKLVLFHREQDLVQFIQTALFELFEGASHSYEAQSIAPSKSGSFVDEDDLVLAQPQVLPGQKSLLDNIYESAPVSPTAAMVCGALFLQSAFSA
jgi:DNA mismatch repair protein PMS2